jgi:two-component system, LuxR family, sensor kinase FixL
MSWVTIIWAMTASACLMLALVHVLVWWQRREAGGNLLFALSGIATAAFAGCELWMMRAETTASFGAAVRWAHIPAWVLVVSLVGFVRLYLRAGRLWLAWTVCGVRTLSLILNLLFTPNLNYCEITALRHVSFLGETVAMGEGTRNPWMLVGQFSLLLLVIYVADAVVSVWRRGDRRQALWVGGSIVIFVVAGTGQVILVLWGFILMPITVSLFYMGIVATMGYELSQEVLRAARLSDDLRESQERMALATHAANVGIWVRDLVRDEFWATDKWRTLFGFAASERIDFNGFLRKLHPEDRQAVKQTLSDAMSGEGDYEKEYRVLLSNGETRWIASRGRVEFDSVGKPVLLRGASLDITTRKQAEETAQALSGRLIHAQEAERMRLARELHDDLSQSLALLSIELEMFGQRPPAERRLVSGRMQEFADQVKRLSSEVHQLSHELHPAKLEQLGLVAAVRGFCQEFATAHEMAIEFAVRPVPRAVPDETALCLYRIAQEALHNAVKHSGGTAAKVELAMEDGELRLAIADDGVGFDPLASRANGSLGLVSMGERARLVHGRLSVESQAGKGTRVEVRVPIAMTAELS